MISYNQEIVINADRAEVVKFLSDPIRVAGMLGHVALLERIDGGNSYYASLVLASQTRVIAVPGKMEGPLFSLSNISYPGASNDGRVRWEIVFDVRERPAGDTVVRVFVSFDIKAGLFGRFSSLPKAIAVMPEHLVKYHIVPYLGSFNGTITERADFRPAFSKEGKLSEIISKAMQVAGSAQIAVIVVEAGLMRAKIVVKEEKVRIIKAYMGPHEFEVGSVNELLKSLPERGKVAVYTLDECSVLDFLTDRVLAFRAV